MCNALRLMQNKYFKLSGCTECESEPCTKPVRSIEKGDIRENLDLRNRATRSRTKREFAWFAAEKFSSVSSPLAHSTQSKVKIMNGRHDKGFFLLYYATWRLFENNMW